jgi:hypothetical protein
VSSPRYDRVKRAIALYSQVIEETLKELRNAYIIDILFIVVVPIGISIIAYFFASISGLLAVLGLGGINAAEKFGRGQTILKSYLGDRSRLKKSSRTLELEIELCDPSDDVSLQNIENKLKEYLSSLP